MADIFEEFEAIYPNEANIQKAFCPYRVCPLGAHSDHQLGIITGFAIDCGIEIAFTPTDDGEVFLHSMNFFGDHRFNIKKIPKKRGDWADYLRGAVTALKREHELEKGVKVVINGALPSGGISSSAALTIAFLSAMCKANGMELTNYEMIENALWAENQYVGVKCGKLDQSVEVLSAKDHLLFLDTKDDTYELIPKNKKLKPYEIAIFFSGLERTLVGSAFNARVDEMKSAAYALKAFSNSYYDTFANTHMREVPYEIFEEYKDKLPDNWRKRAMHFYTEFERVQKGVKAWREGDIEAFGKLMFESGESSINNYETGSPELKTLHNIMAHTDGIYGGRFSGAGFKGCCMAIVDPSKKDAIEEQVTREYLEAFPHLEGKFKVYFCKSADGCNFKQSAN